MTVELATAERGCLRSVSDRGGLWRQSRVATAAFGPQPQFSRFRPALLRVVLLAQLAVADRRSNESGSAVCCLSGASVWPRVRGTIGAMGLLAVSAGLFMASLLVMWPVVALVLAVGLLFVPMARVSLAAGPARRALRRCRPHDVRPVVVHTVASVERGAGRMLLESVLEEADRKRWTLVLDAGNERLASYYAGLGFEPTGEAVDMPWGDRNVPMARPPSRLRGGRDG